MDTNVEKLKQDINTLLSVLPFSDSSTKETISNILNASLFIYNKYPTPNTTRFMDLSSEIQKHVRDYNTLLRTQEAERIKLVRGFIRETKEKILKFQDSCVSSQSTEFSQVSPYPTAATGEMVHFIFCPMCGQRRTAIVIVCGRPSCSFIFPADNPWLPSEIFERICSRLGRYHLAEFFKLTAVSKTLAKFVYSRIDIWFNHIQETLPFNVTTTAKFLETAKHKNMVDKLPLSHYEEFQGKVFWVMKLQHCAVLLYSETVSGFDGDVTVRTSFVLTNGYVITACQDIPFVYKYQ